MGRKTASRRRRARLVLCGLLLAGCGDSEPEPTQYGDAFAPGPKAASIPDEETPSAAVQPALAPTALVLAQKESREVGTKTAAPLEAESEGIMGKRDTPRATGQFAMKNQEASGVDLHGGLMGNEVGEVAGGWGYGVSGAGPGGGGTGWGTIGTGSYGTIGAGPGAPGGSFASQARSAGVLGVLGHSQTAGARADSEMYRSYGFGEAVDASKDALSTFAADVDTASYSIFRRKRREDTKIPPDSIRTEEFLNYFRYSYQGPQDGGAFAVHLDAAPSPYTDGHHLLRVGVQGKKIAKSARKPSHLVFLVDVSGSMSSPDKLGLAKRALRILVDNLNDGDTVGLVTYAGSVREVLQPTGLEHRAQILSAIEDLSASGSTSMGSGLELAYRMAARKLGPKSLSRVIVLSDGDANVGRTDHTQILKTIRAQVKEGVTLSTIGFGMGNYKDDLMEQLANKGNGNYYYVDGLMQARRIFQEELGGTLEVIAKDLKIQVEFDPKAVKSYRLLGYENRDVADKDFRNDRVDAGELGAGHRVTALYEVKLASPQSTVPFAKVRLRAKKPRGEKAEETIFNLQSGKVSSSFNDASADFRFAVAVAGVAEILRKNPAASEWRLSGALKIAEAASAGSSERQEFVELIRGL